MAWDRSMLIDLTGYPLRLNWSTAGRIFWHGPHQSAWKSSRMGSDGPPSDEDEGCAAVRRAISRVVARVIPQGLLSLGRARGGASRRGRRARAGPARCHTPRREARNDPLAGPPVARRAN